MIGVSNLSNIPLRREPASQSEMVSELLFGEAFSVISQENDWTQLLTEYDQYTGWINSKQFEMLDAPIQHNATSCIYPFVKASSNKGTIMVPAGSSLPGLQGKHFIINNTPFILTQENRTYTFSQVAELALQYEHVPYLWGGRTPFGIDCSGLTQVVFKQCHIPLKRDAYQQAEQGEVVAFREEARCGDLAFFDNEDGRITHVGIMLDASRIIHAHGRVRIDIIDHFGIMNSDDRQYSHKLRIIKRMVP